MPPETPAKRPFNALLDASLIEAANTYVKANPRVRSVSELIERELIRLLRVKGRKYKIKVPTHLIQKP